MFEGFSQEALDFLNDIRFNNNQAFYAANQARYERFVKRPMRELSDELAPVVQLIDPKLDTRPGRTMSRIRRDTRYTKDKSPFRDHAWLGWRYPGEGRGEGFHMYWGFGPDWQPLAAEIARRGWTPTFICESAGTQAEDARTMKDIYRAQRALYTGQGEEETT